MRSPAAAPGDAGQDPAGHSWWRGMVDFRTNGTSEAVVAVAPSEAVVWTCPSKRHCGQKLAGSILVPYGPRVSSLGVYLVRHGEAERHAPGGDAHRPLSGAGRRAMRRVAAFVAEQRAAIDHIVTSPMVRAVQTAEILASALQIEEPVEVEPELASPRSIEALIQRVGIVPTNTRGVALVGHEPTLSALTTHVLGMAASIWPGFRTSQVVALDHDRRSGTFTFRWAIDPRVPSRVESLE